MVKELLEGGNSLFDQLNEFLIDSQLSKQNGRVKAQLMDLLSGIGNDVNGNDELVNILSLVFSHLNEILPSIKQDHFADRLTGFGNRKQYDKTFQKFLNDYQEFRTPFSLALLEIDDWQEYSKPNNYGDAGIHGIYREFAKSLSEFVGEKCVLLRLLGHKFGILGQLSKDEMLHMLEQFQSYYFSKNSIRIDTIGGSKIVLSFSAGVKGYVYGETIHELYLNTNSVLFEAKKQGGDLILVNDD